MTHMRDYSDKHWLHSQIATERELRLAARGDYSVAILIGLLGCLLVAVTAVGWM